MAQLTVRQDYEHFYNRASSSGDAEFADNLKIYDGELVLFPDLPLDVSERFPSDLEDTILRHPPDSGESSDALYEPVFRWEHTSSTDLTIEVEHPQPYEYSFFDPQSA